MKKLSALLSLALGLSLIPATFAADTKPAPGAKTAPAAAATPATEPKKDEPVVGILVERATGGFFNLKVEDGKFVMLFLDAEKKETEADVPSATVRYRKHKADQRFRLTRSEDGKSLRGTLPVDRPYIFKTLRIALIDDSEETPAETYVKNFKQLAGGEPESIPVDEMTPEQLQKVAR
ncbi:MAG TPA: hypothetical protein PK322_14710 [Opitutaceae bacterium]|nr:hypothetical protein [Opitutaceae bacterium]